MQVFVELALFENFCMDFVLLFSAKTVCKTRTSYFRIVLASILGAVGGVVLPIFKLGNILRFLIKIILGLVICLFSCKFRNVKAYFKLTGAFFFFTFLLGGALIAVFNLGKFDYIEGQGYLISSIPIGIPLFFGLLLTIFAKKLSARFTKSEKQQVNCKIFLNDNFIEMTAFFDSGNKVYHSGQPVSFIPLSTSLKIIDINCIKECVKIHTVAGSKKIKVFTADKIELNISEKVQIIEKVKIGVSPYVLALGILHPDLLEEICLKN